MYEKLNKPSDISRCFKYGKKVSGKYVVVYFAKNNSEFSRRGIVASKKIGNAVKRNRAKRVIRAALFKGVGGSALPKGFDIVIIAGKNATECKSFEIEPFFSRLKIS
jgi:ribonuclease P protein component